MKNQIRNLADFVRTGGENADIDFISRDTATEVESALREYNEWLDRVIPEVSQSNEASGIIWQLINAKEQLACENGMKAGARLIVDLLGVVEKGGTRA